MSRFDYLKYDADSIALQEMAKRDIQFVEQLIDGIGSDKSADGTTRVTTNERFKASGRAKALALTKLEEVYMWIGKAIRDDQIARGKTELQEERANS